MKRKSLTPNHFAYSILSFLVILITQDASAQLSIDAGATAYTINFDATVSGVNNGQYAGGGLSPTPGSGLLNSNGWAVSLSSSNYLGFGGTSSSVEYARGQSSGGVSSTAGCLYAFQVASGNYAFGIQPQASPTSQFITASTSHLTLKLNNNTGKDIIKLAISYKIWNYNDQGRSSQLNFAYSADNSSYTNISALDFTSPTTADASPSWQSVNRSTTITGLSIAPGADYYLRWIGGDIVGAGSRDEFALDDISVTATVRPIITVSTGGPLAFGSIETGALSTEQSYTVSGTDLLSNITVSAPANYQVSKTSGSGFGSSVTLVQSGGVVNTTTIYVRMNPVSAGAHNSNITHTATSATQQDVSVTGTGVVAPTCVVSDDFDDNDFTSSPAWSGNSGSFSVISAGTVPNGSATTDGSYLASNSSAGSVAMTTPSTITDEWRFSLATPDFSPSGVNYFGVILMSDSQLTGDISAKTWRGYYLRIGNNISPDPIRLYKSTGVTKAELGSGFSSPDFNSNALKNGLNFRVTRSSSNVFEVFYSTGFLYDVVPTTSAGTITDATAPITTSSYFGVYQRYSTTDADHRVYFDNFCAFERTYTWLPTTGTADWTVSTNWSPARTSPAASDILVFDRGGASIATNIPTAESIRKLSVSNNTQISLRSATASGSTLTITGSDNGDDFIVGSGSELIFDSDPGASTSYPVIISLGVLATGSVSGTITFDRSSGNQPAHRLLTNQSLPNSSTINFKSGSVFYAKDFSGDPFGSTLPKNSHIFEDGSLYIKEAGNAPFGYSQPDSKVVFQSGSTYRHKSGIPSLPGRTYATFELDYPGTASIYNGSASAVTIENLTITSGTFDFPLTTNNTPLNINLTGVLTVVPGATFNYSPTNIAAASTFNFAGPGNGVTGKGSIIFGDNATAEINDVVNLSGGTHPLINGTLSRKSGGVVASAGGGSFSFGSASTLSYNGTSSLAASLEWPDWNSASGPTNININMPGQAVTLSSGKEVTGTLSVKTGSTLNTNGHLMVQSGGSLLKGAGTPGGNDGTVNGSVYVRRTGTTQYLSYNFWSSPVQSANISVLSSRGLYFYDPSKASDGTVQGLRDGWVDTSGITMTPGKGYTALAGGTVLFSGTVNDGNVSINVDKNNGAANNVGYNLIGNPYPCAIDADLFLNANSSVIEGQIYLWDDNGSNGANWVTSHEYVTYNYLGANQTGNNNGVTFKGYIASGQGFFVEKTDDTPASEAVQFQNSMKVVGENDAFFRQAAIPRLWMKISDASGNFNETLIGFVNDATDGADWGYDAKKLKGNELSLYSKINGKDYAIQGLPTLTEDKMVSMGMDISASGQHTIKLEQMEHLDETVVVMLEDRDLGIFQNLNLNPAYTFTANKGTNIQRFYLHFNAPLKISSNEVSCNGADGQIMLDQPGTMKWNYILANPQGQVIASGNDFNGTVSFAGLAQGAYTLALSDNNGYQITKSIDVDAKIPVVAAFESSKEIIDVNEQVDLSSQSSGASQFEWDFGDGTVITGVENPSHSYWYPGTFEVKLKAMNNDCEAEAFKILTVLGPTGISRTATNTVSVYSMDNKIFVRFDFAEEKPATVSLFNLLGMELYHGEMMTSGIHELRFSNLPSNNYLVKVQTNDQTMVSKVQLIH